MAAWPINGSNVDTWDTALKAYLDDLLTQDVRPTASPVFVAVNEILFGRLDDVRAIGDSLTASGIYAALLQTSLGVAWKVTNKGLDGDTTTEMLARFSTDVTDSHAKYVIIWGGINDILADATAVAIEGNLQSMYSAAHTAGLTVIAVNISPFKTHAGWTAGRQTVLDAVNTWIAGTATDVDYVVDVYTELEDPVNEDQLLAAYDSGDHIHLSTAGYTVVAATVYAEPPVWTETSGTVYLRISDDVVLDQDVGLDSSPSFNNLRVRGDLTIDGDIVHQWFNQAVTNISSPTFTGVSCVSASYPYLVVDASSATTTYPIVALRAVRPSEGNTAAAITTYNGATDVIAQIGVLQGSVAKAGSLQFYTSAGAGIIARMKIKEDGTIYIPNNDIELGTSTGTKIGTATNQKLGFYNATPIVQAANTSDIKDALVALGFIATGGATPLDLDAGQLTCGNIYPSADNTYYLGKNDDDTPFAYKGLILKDQAGTGKDYRLEVYNDALRIVDLTD